MTATNILVLNAGSATLKYAVYGPVRAASPGECLTRGQVDLAAGSREASVQRALRECDRALEPFAIAAVGHRIVHGGAKFTAPVIIDDAVVAELDALQPLAPLHQALGLAVVGAARTQRPQVPHVAAFDTAFHASMPMVAQRFALPQVWFDRGVRRFGFHGLSYEFIASKLAQMRASEPTQRVVVAHLGSGASLCAMRDGRSVATTMSFTPTDGLMMATRSGALDPGAVLYLVREHRMNVDAVERLLNLESGLLGVSGVSGDIRALLANSDPACAARGGVVRAPGRGRDRRDGGGARRCRWHRVHRRHRRAPASNQIARLRRARVARRGIATTRSTRAGQMRFDSGRGTVGLWNIPTDEEAVIAEHTARLLHGQNDA